MASLPSANVLIYSVAQLEECLINVFRFYSDGSQKAKNKNVVQWIGVKQYNSKQRSNGG